MDTLRESVLKNRFAMERFCYDHGGKIDGGYVQNYGYIVETERYRYCLRCNPSPGDYNGYLDCYTIWLSSGRTWRGTSPWWAASPMPMATRRSLRMRKNFSVAYRKNFRIAPPQVCRYEVLTDDPNRPQAGG